MSLHHHHPSAGELAFCAYTRFPQAEAFVESHIGLGAREFFNAQQRASCARFLAWSVLVSLPLQLAAVLFSVGVDALGLLLGGGSLWQVVPSIASLVFCSLGVRGLFGRTRRGWALYVYGLAAGALGSTLELSLFLLVVYAVLFVLAFQIKGEYQAVPQPDA